MATKISMYCFIILLIVIAAKDEKPDYVKVDFTKKLDVSSKALTTKTYTAFLKELGKKLADTYSGKQKVPVLQLYNKLKPRGFDVVLTSGSNTTTARFRRDDLYLVGYQMQKSPKKWYEFGEKAKKPPPPQLIKGSEFLEFEGSYPALEGIAGSVVKMEINRKKLITSVGDLGWSENKKERAEALLVVIQMISEAARFLDISSHFGSNLEKNAKLPEWMRKDLENNWSDLSYMVLKSEGDPCYNFSSTLRPVINNKKIETINELRNYFGIMYRDADTLKPPCSKSLHEELR